MNSYLHPADRGQDAEQCGQRQHPLHPLPTYDPTILVESVRGDTSQIRRGRVSSSLPPLYLPRARSARTRVVTRARAKRNGRLGRACPYMRFRCCGTHDTPVVIPPRAQRTTAASAARRRWVGRSLAHRGSKMAARVGRYAVRQAAGQSRRGRPLTGAVHMRAVASR